MFNIIDIIVILVILASVFIGYKKGFVRTVINLLSFFVAIGVALMFYKPVAVILTENTPIDDWIINNIMSEENEETGNNSNILNDIKASTSTNTNDETNNAEGIEALLDMVGNLPDAVIGNFELQEIKNDTKHQIAYKISELIMNLLSLIIIYVVVKVTLTVATFILDGIMKIPVLKQLNELLGMTIGAVIGFLQVYISFAVITFISSICDIAVVIDAIKVSAFASVLFENNLIIKLLF